MNEKIKNILKQIEGDNNIKIIFAIENGSRSWVTALYPFMKTDLYTME